jgi:hypothetical protein
MIRSVIFLLVLLALAAAAPSSGFAGRIAIASTTTSRLPEGWKVVREARPHEEVEFRILMKHRNIDALDKLFWAVSDPRSPRYGQFATREELEALVGASEESFAVVEKWLAPHRSSFSLYAKYYASIKIRAPASVVRELFQVPVFVYSHHRVSGERIRIAGEASVPAEVAQEIEFVAGLSEFIEDRLQAMAHRPRRARSRAPSAPDPEVTPALLRQYYQVPNEVVNASTRQGIAAFYDYFSMGFFFFDFNLFLLVGRSLQRHVVCRDLRVQMMECWPTPFESCSQAFPCCEEHGIPCEVSAAAKARRYVVKTSVDVIPGTPGFAPWCHFCAKGSVALLPFLTLAVGRRLQPCSCSPSDSVP